MVKGDILFWLQISEEMLPKLFSTQYDAGCRAARCNPYHVEGWSKHASKLSSFFLSGRGCLIKFLSSKVLFSALYFWGFQLYFLFDLLSYSFSRFLFDPFSRSPSLCWISHSHHVLFFFSIFVKLSVFSCIFFCIFILLNSWSGSWSISFSFKSAAEASYFGRHHTPLLFPTCAPMRYVHLHGKLIMSLLEGIFSIKKLFPEDVSLGVV